MVRECGHDVTCPVAKEVIYTLKERAYVEQIEKAFSYASKVLLDFLMEGQELLAHLRCGVVRARETHAPCGAGSCPPPRPAAALALWQRVPPQPGTEDLCPCRTELLVWARVQLTTGHLFERQLPGPTRSAAAGAFASPVMLSSAFGSLAHACPSPAGPSSATS